jgi:hypothetical protein
MNAISWLAGRKNGLAELTAQERSAVSEFSLLWTYFEATYLNENASARAIVELARAMEAAKQIDLARLKEPVSYFQRRYAHNGEFTHHFPYLNLRRNNQPGLVKNMLLGKVKEPSELLAAALIIVLRYRNNLFHGLKWAYGLRGQHDNFQTASSLLIAVAEMRSTDRLAV